MTPRILSSDLVATEWQCGSCGYLWSEEALAETCCGSHLCVECRTTIISPGKTCSECLEGDRAALESALYAGAARVYYQDYEEPVFFWSAGGENGGFFHTRTELEKFCMDKQLQYPRWVWGCVPSKISLNAESILKSYYPSIFDHLDPESTVSLQKILDLWAGDQDVSELRVDYAMAVILDRQLLEAESAPIGDADD